MLHNIIWFQMIWTKRLLLVTIQFHANVDYEVRLKTNETDPVKTFMSFNEKCTLSPSKLFS